MSTATGSSRPITSTTTPIPLQQPSIPPGNSTTSRPGSPTPPNASNSLPRAVSAPSPSPIAIQSLQQLNITNAELIYSPINSQEIRILILQRGNFGDGISCTLNHEQLDTSHQYEALSYCWGDLLNPPTISLNSYQFHITANLEAALRQIRSKDVDRRLWIDALCINQSDIIERNNQVRKMHLIYAGAEQVLAWIGNDEPDQPPILDVVRCAEELEFCEEFMQKCVEHINTFGALFTQYWKRVWIVQEIAHAKQVKILCGSGEISYLALQHFLMLLKDTARRGSNEYNLRFAQALHDFTTINPVQSHGGKLRIGDVLAAVHLRHCQDPRDKVFGILSLFPEEVQSMIRVDYSADVAEIYMSAVRAILDVHGDLNDLSYRRRNFDQPENGVKQLPSWCLDFSLDEDYLHGFSFISRYNACGLLGNLFEFAGKTLQVQGVKLGEIDKVRVQKWDRDSNGSLRLTSLLNDIKTYFEDLGDMAPDDLSTFVTTCLGGLEMNDGELIETILQLIKNSLSGECAQISDDMDWKLGNDVKRSRYRAYFNFKPVTTSPRKLPVNIEDLRKSIGTSSTDKIAPGDTVAVLSGFRAPVILRPSGDHYEFICDAYIDMFMFGEATMGFDQNANMVKTFSIC